MIKVPLGAVPSPPVETKVLEYRKSKIPKSFASHAGNHFITEFITCRRKWAFHYLYGYENKFLSIALIDGAAIHYAKDKFYKGAGLAKTQQAYTDYVQNALRGCEDVDAMTKRYAKSMRLLELWIDKFGNIDKFCSSILGVEYPFELRLDKKGKYVYSGRFDCVLNSGKDIYVLDTKRTGFSVKETEISFKWSDQVTGYLWAAKQIWPGYKNYYAMGDIMYWNDVAKHEENIDLHRTEPITRSKEALEQFVEYTIDNFVEIGQRVAEAKKLMAAQLKKKKKVNHVMNIFGRTDKWCSAFFRTCEYAGICMENYKIGDRPSENLKKVKPIIKL
jgi:hypothetical protein